MKACVCFRFKNSGNAFRHSLIVNSYFFPHDVVLQFVCGEFIAFAEKFDVVLLIAPPAIEGFLVVATNKVHVRAVHQVSFFLDFEATYLKKAYICKL